MENQIIQINLVPNMSTPAVVRVSQYDVGRPLVFKVYDGTSPADLTGVTAVIEGTKKSGLGFSESGTVSGNTVTLDTTLAMTQEDGSIPAEIRFTKTGEDVGTANFILAVEPSPHLEGTTDGTTETMADLQSQLDALDERVEALEEGGGGGGLTDAVKSAMLQIAQKVAYIDEHGQTYYDALYDALYPPAELVSISAVYTQSGTVYDTDTLDSLKPDLVVTAYYDNQTSAVVTNYTLSGTLTVGTSTITVSYGGKSTTFNVTVTHYDNSIYSWDFTNGITDSKQGVVAQLGSGATQNANGITMDGTVNGWVILTNLSAYASASFTVEMDVETLTMGGTEVGVLTLNTTTDGAGSGAGLRVNSDMWRFRTTANGWVAPTPKITGIDYFNNSTLKWQVDYANTTWNLYKDGTLATGSGSVYRNSNNRNVLAIGSSGSGTQLGANSVIKALRIYEGVV